MKLLFSLFVSLIAFIPARGQERAAGTRTILFFGDSLTAGYGLENHSEQAFPGLIQQKLDQEKLPYRIINAGLSGDTSAGGLRRIDWVLRQPIDIFVLGLGANDGLRGLAVEGTKSNLEAIIGKVRARNPSVRILLAGMQMPRSMGSYAKDFAAIFPALAESSQTTLIPFLLEGVGGIPALNLPDGIHPTAEGHQRIAETIWQYLLPLIK